jgi:hypothetical protein
MSMLTTRIGMGLGLTAIIALMACNVAIDEEPSRESSQAVETVGPCKELKCTVLDYDIHKIECHWHAIQCKLENPGKAVGFCACFSEMGMDGQTRPLEGHYFRGSLLQLVRELEGSDLSRQLRHRVLLGRWDASSESSRRAVG